MESSGALEKNNQSFTIYADDEAHCLTAMNMVFTEIQLGQRLLTFDGGQKVIDYFKDLLEALDVEESEDENSIESCPSSQPVSLLILDSVMPGVNGFDVAEKVKQLFDAFQIKNSKANIIRPLFVFLSQSDYNHTFKLMLFE